MAGVGSVQKAEIKSRAGQSAHPACATPWVTTQPRENHSPRAATPRPACASESSQVQVQAAGLGPSLRRALVWDV